jgi:pSer/pThr/pTyr-binding forkhead associated (FHA) protein
MRTLRLQNLKLALRADSGLAIGTVHPLDLDRMILGRSVEADVPVDDKLVSRTHAAIDFSQGFFHIVDLGSTNGTYLNGSRVDCAARISVGDELRLGSSVFMVEPLDDAKSSAGSHWRESTKVLQIGRRESSVLAVELDPPHRKVVWPQLSSHKKWLVWLSFSGLLLLALMI